MKIAGIDPGKKGHMTILDTVSNQAWTYPLKFDKQNQYDLEWFKIVRSILQPGDLIIVEKVSAVSGNIPVGKTQTFNFGFICGQIGIAARVSGFRFRYIVPQTWQKLMHEGITGNLTPKEKSKIAYEQFCPSNPFEKPRGGKISTDLIDSLLISMFGVLKYGGGKLREWEFERACCE